jgi:hypothetical protein
MARPNESTVNFWLLDPPLIMGKFDINISLWVALHLEKLVYMIILRGPRFYRRPGPQKSQDRP